ncbi:hypothetical protein M3664_04335 [Paenibacillus lautus]|uniref:hypothetical protein n=1 Tax=Paenibacillus lautus TaxID=1401 RepID=UPI00203FAA10|nr:hypothetical protein [Paenibacillus lautus]MCM3257008.1 hypothetical protein [Paenibacillus lautus]
MTELHKPVYIPSIEGSDIYNHMYRGRDIDFKYIGMIPSSLELNKLTTLGFKTKSKKTNSKLISSDIINVKFKQKVDSGKQSIKRIELKLSKLDEDRYEYKEKLSNFAEMIRTELGQEKWNGLSQSDLRHKLYTTGFTINGIKYVVYKRSSAKSRIGQCLFIKEDLYEPMIKWSRMGIEFRNEGIDIDYPSLLAYESLVGSSLEDTVYINPKNILIVNDVSSTFSRLSNVVRTGKDGYLDSFPEESIISNSLFDGESLLESSYFSNGKSMMLLRNHMFKSAAFSCNIQKFLKDHTPSGIDYDTWEISNMYSEKILAKDIHLITTPSSVKALKFSNLKGSDKKMWDYWRKFVLKDKCVFGVCKSEKKSKRGYDEYGKVLQQTSYQMINSLPITKDDIKNFTQLEKEYITKLKNDDEFFISYLDQNKNDMNTNEMFVDLYLKNNQIAKTKIFKNFRKKTISSYVTHIKNGKVRLKGDYCVMLGNPIEFLFHSIGQLDTANPKALALHNNEVYTSMFEETELTGFRNPHTSPNNVLLVTNKKTKYIDDYLNLSNNIVCVNAIDFPLQDILSGCDYDSDTVLLIKDKYLLDLTKKVFGKYNVCVNKVTSSKRKYHVNNTDMAIIDNELSNSQRYIGRTVNTGQLCMSRYWDLLNKGQSEIIISELMKKIDVVTVLSGICIDLAKKMFEIDINKEIDRISKTNELLKEKPLFWRYVSQSKSIETKKYDCPMDFLFEEMDRLNYADQKEEILFKDLLIVRDAKKSNRRQENKVLSYVETMVSKINNTYSSNFSEDERERRIDDIIKYYRFFVEKIQINENTMYSLLLKISNNKRDKIATRLLNTLYLSQKAQFLSSFSSKSAHF